MSTSIEEMQKTLEEIKITLLKLAARTKILGFGSLQQISAATYAIEALQDLFSNIEATDWVKHGKAILSKIIIIPVAAASLLEIAIRTYDQIQVLRNPNATRGEITTQTVEWLFSVVVGMGVGVFLAVNYEYFGEDDDFLAFANTTVFTGLLSPQALVGHVLSKHLTHLAEKIKNTLMEKFSRKGLYTEGVALMSELRQAPLPLDMGVLQDKVLSNFVVSQHKKTDGEKTITISNNALNQINDFTANSIMADRQKSMFNSSSYMVLLSLIIPPLLNNKLKGAKIILAFTYQILTVLFASIFMNVNYVFATGASHSQRKTNIEDGSVAQRLGESMRRGGVMKREARETQPLLSGQVNRDGDFIEVAVDGSNATRPGLRNTPSRSEEE